MSSARYPRDVLTQTSANIVRTALIALFGSSSGNDSQILDQQQQESWKTYSKDRVRVAARTTNEILESMMTNGIHVYASPMR